MALTGTFSLVSLKDLLPVLPDVPLGDASLDVTLASGQVKAPVRLAGALPGALTFQAGAAFAVAALNGSNGSDPSGIVGAAESRTPGGTFSPLLRFDGTAGWLKYSASAETTDNVRVAAGNGKVAGTATAGVVSDDYRRHALRDLVVVAMAADLAAMRSATVLDHVLGLPEGDALALESRGQIACTLSIAWSDVFTSELGPLTRLLGAGAPIAIRVRAGATCSVKVTLSDSWIVAFARPIDAGGALRVAVKKGEVTDAGVRGAVTVTASLADAGSIEAVLDDVVAGVLERLGMEGAGLAGSAADDLRSAIASRLQSLVETKVRAGFAYEYHRISKDVAIFEADVPPDGLDATLHRELLTGDLAAAFAHPPADIAVRRFLNEHTSAVSEAWGFTLGLGKWKLFGQDRRRLTAVTRADAATHEMTRSYIGSGGYARTKLTWAADFAADLTEWTARPQVREYRFGLHLAWTRDRQEFSDGDLADALDFAALWSICPESSLAWLRQHLAEAVEKQAQWSFHVRVADEALRPMFRVFGAMRPVDLAGAAAAALGRQWVASVSARRRMYAPLWRAVLESRDRFRLDAVAPLADRLLDRPELADRERWTASQRLYDPGTVAGIVAYDGEWPESADRFLRGCRLLADAIDSSAEDSDTIPEAYRHLASFWTESHYVRTLGAALVDAARTTGHAAGVERTLRLSWGDASPTATLVVSSRMF
ncbi:MAG: hypothetical protein ACM3SQ_01390 [Betaproteobacteria bacterium]